MSLHWRHHHALTRVTQTFPDKTAPAELPASPQLVCRTCHVCHCTLAVPQGTVVCPLCRLPYGWQKNPRS